MYLKHLLKYEQATPQQIQEELHEVYNTYTTKFLTTYLDCTNHSVYGYKRKSYTTKPSYKNYLLMLELLKGSNKIIK